jgi:HK97 family phage major capsid protein
VAESFLQADGIVINPGDWAELRLLKDGNDAYIGGSPFSNGGAQPTENLFGRRVVVTSAISPCTALVGAFGQGGALYRRGGMVVEASNSHADYFRKDLVAIRAEVRVALAIHRPEAFATVATGLS